MDLNLQSSNLVNLACLYISCHWYIDTWLAHFVWAVYYHLFLLAMLHSITVWTTPLYRCWICLLVGGEGAKWCWSITHYQDKGISSRFLSWTCESQPWVRVSSIWFFKLILLEYEPEPRCYATITLPYTRIYRLIIWCSVLGISACLLVERVTSSKGGASVVGCGKLPCISCFLLSPRGLPSVILSVFVTSFR